MRTLNYLILLVSILFSCSTKLQSQIFYAGSSNGVIYRINPSDCSTDTLCNTQPNGMLDIAFCNGILYGTNNGNIFSIDTITGTQSIVYNSTSPNFNSMVGDENNNLYLASQSSGNIYKYDLSFNTLTNIGDVGMNAIGDLTFKDDFLYLTAGTKSLIKITLSPFSYSEVGTLNFGFNAYGLVTIPSSDSSSTIYASSFSGINIIFQINETNANCTMICSSLPDVYGSIEGLAYQSKKPYGLCNFDLFNGCSIFPNPTSNEFAITVPPTTTQIQILNSLGQIVKETLVDKQTNFNFTIDNSGLYFLQITTNKLTVTKKIIVTN
jgi:hypothetical protein